MSTENMGGCCAQPKGLTKLTFMDDVQVAIIGLDEILAAICAEGRPANDETADVIIARLAMKNYIPSSEEVRREYRYALLKEYREYIKRQTEDSPS